MWRRDYIPTLRLTRPFGYTLLLTVMILGILLLLSEVTLRLIFNRAFPPRFFEAHTDVGHFHIPGRSGWLHTVEHDSYITINKQGLRDRSYSYTKPAGVFRILFIGDSFVEGFQVAQDATFEARLEDQLNINTPVEVINGGVSSYGTDNALLFLEYEGLKYQPDLVIYGFHPNDVTDNIENNLFYLEQEQLVQQPGAITFSERLHGVLYDVSYLYRFQLGMNILARPQTNNTLIETGWGPVLPIYRETLRPSEVEAWTLTAALLDRMQARAAEAGADLLIVYLPEQFQSEDSLWAQVETASETLRRDAPNASLERYLPDGAHFLDLWPVFCVHAQDEKLYYPFDGHFTPLGHQLAADTIQGYLTANGYFSHTGFDAGLESERAPHLARGYAQALP